MNRTEVITKVAQSSGVNTSDCSKVLDSLEQVLTEEFGSSKGTRNAFDKVYRLMDFLRTKGEKEEVRSKE